MVEGVLARQSVSIRHGRTSGQLWSDWGLPKLKNGPQFLSRLLCLFGCEGGRAEAGGIASKVFDPDKVAKQKEALEPACRRYYRVVRFAMLNERQATFLIGLMRNSPEVVDFKLRMAHEFWRMGDALANRDRTLLTRRILLEQREGRSAALASIGSGLMLDRRRALPGINAERDVLRSVMEPGLFPQELDVAIDKTKSRKRGPKTILGYRKMPSPASAKRAA